MSNAQKCPSVDQLQQLAVGRLPDPPAGSLEEHLLECDACAQQTAQLHQADTLMAAMKHAGQARVDRSPEEQVRLERLMSSLSGLHAGHVEATLLTPAPGPGEVLVNESDEVTRELSAAWRPAEEADEIGRIGNYRILKVLGAGGMGGVFLAEDLQLHRRVALKLMRPRVASTPGAAERFLREARAAAALRHDHVITIYQVGEEAGVPFLAMEYLEGETLDDRLRRESPLPVLDVLHIGREIAEGLAAAHAKGLIHRDIKPANVWLEGSRLAPRDEAGTREDVPMGSTANDRANTAHALPVAERQGYLEGEHHSRVKLLDFGLARSIEAESTLTSSGMIIGTPSYMAPEQASGETLDARADLFSLGVILYRMTTGQLPFPGRKMMEILKSLATVTPAAPQSLNPVVPQELSDLIERLLAKDRDARPASAREVAKALGVIASNLTEPPEGDCRMGTPARPALSPVVVGTGRTTALTEHQSQNPKMTGKSAHPTRRVATALGAVSAVLLLAVVLFVMTRGGTLKIEAGDGIDVSVVKEQVTIRDTVSGKTYEVSVGENTVRPGQYEIVLRDPASGLKVSTDRVEIQRGNSTPLRITLQADLAANGLRRGSPESATDSDLRAAEWVLSIGGSVAIRVHGQDRDVADLKELPVQPFALWTVNFTTNQQVTDADMAKLKGLTNLEKLTISNTSISDAGLVHIQELVNLETLNLPQTKITDAGLARLTKLTRLKSLHLGDTDVGDAGLEHVAKLPQLEKLYLWKTEVGNAGLAHLATLANLKFLELAATNVTDAGLAHLQGLKQLTHLTIGPDVTDAGLIHLKGLTNLTELEMISTQVTDAGLEQLKELKQLHSLNLAGTKAITDMGLAHLMPLTSLAHLDVGGTRVSDVGVVRLNELKGLTELGLADTQVTAAAVGQLKKSLPNCEVRYGPSTKMLVAPSANRTIPTYTERQAAEWVIACGGKVTLKLKGGGSFVVSLAKDLPSGNLHVLRISLDGCGDKVTDAGLEHVRGLRDLTHLYLQVTRVTDFGLDHVAGLTTLLDLRLNGTLVTDAGLERVKDLPQLTGLSLDKTNVTDQGLANLVGLKALGYLDLNGTQVSDAGMEQLVALPALINLDVSGTQVTDAGLRTLSARKNWTKLEISGPGITDAGLEHLKEMAALTLLIVTSDGVTDVGLTHLAGLTQLETLTLACPKVTPAGIEKLKQALPKCKVTR